MIHDLRDYPHASIRGHFEPDARFEGERPLAALIVAYNHACRMAGANARYSLIGDQSPREKVIKWEAVAATLECVLGLYPHTSDVRELSQDDEFEFDWIE